MLLKISGQQQGTCPGGLKSSDLNLLQGESPETVAHYQKELSRLKHIYPLGEKQWLCATVELALAQHTLKVATLQDNDQDRYFGSDALQRDIEALSLKASDLEADIRKAVSEREDLMAHVLPPILKKLGDMQETMVLDGDFEFKVGQQDYYLSKQKRMMDHLLLQQARHCFLHSIMQTESKLQDRTSQLFCLMIHELQGFGAQVQDRQVELDRLKNNDCMDERTTIDQRDSFSWCLHRMLGGQMPEGSFTPMESISNLAVQMQEARTSANSFDDASERQMHEALAEIALCIHQAQETTSSAYPPSHPKAFHASLDKLQQLSKELKVSLQGLSLIHI
eukprot:TRINITY_DN27820_c0_g1_i1.p1 TRINITY_DN27820_c0_g1~~TRINITY_DN27820_c0_g1_i1.p1  ORF type:complete len:336 (+),score=44.58 TRINITY_DN27820_c0_g1_i1:238-1245(+)